MFNRPPRIQSVIKEYTVELVPPPPVPSRPKINWATIGLPILAMGLVVTLMFFFFSSTSGLSFIYFLPFMLASPLASYISYHGQKKEYENVKSASIKEFQNEILLKAKIVDGFTTEQRNIINNNHPSPSECQNIIFKRELRIGERRPQDPDFLTFRLGLGIARSKIKVTGIPVENRDPLYNNLYMEADELVNESSKLRETAIICDLKKIGSLGVVGDVENLRQFGWSTAVQLVTHHWPAELNIASFTSFVEAKNWKWLEGIQHKVKIFENPVIELRQNEGVKRSLIQLEEELRRRRSLLDNLRAISSNNSQDVTLPILVIIFDRVSGIYNHAAFALLLKEGRELGVHGIFLTDSVDDLPSECGAYFNMESETFDYKVTGTHGESVDNIKVDIITGSLLESFSRSLASMDWLIPERVTDPPESLSLLDLFPLIKLNDLPLDTWWSGEYPLGYLRTPIGKLSPTAELIFDLNDSDTGHGPHGLIGGMTGSGKSELLKTLILSLAITHHPYDVNFALIDYKGGGAFSEFHGLPHVVGVITDIQNHADYATRVVQSLFWEVKRRETILADARDSFGLIQAHIDEYRSELPVKIPVPRLVIIFDEFAEFQERHPEESKKLINIARIGRSLGVHLILCTQNPMGRAVDQQVRDNSNFTICLKVKTPETSKSLVNIPDAIQLRRGFAYFHVNGPLKFKVAYTGGDLDLDSRSVMNKSSSVVERTYFSQRVSEAQAIIEEISSRAKQINIPILPEIWPDPLPEQLTMTKLFNKLGARPSWNGSGWERNDYRRAQIPLGLLDDPSHQKQSVLCINDHTLIFGPSGSGKSTTLLTIAMGVALQYSPEEAFMYCIDISGQGPLNFLSKWDMPHLPSEGGVIHGNDLERINRLFKMIRLEMTKRIGDFTDIHSDNSQRIRSNQKPAPYIFIMVDGLNQLFNSDNPGFRDQIDFIMRHGYALGIYVLITGNHSRDIPEILHTERTVIILQSTDRGTISSLVGRPPETYQKKIEAGQEPKPGRGVINMNPALEIQIAFPGFIKEEVDEEIQVSNFQIQEKIEKGIKTMANSWRGEKRPPDVLNLPNFIPVSLLARDVLKEQFIVGKSQESLNAVGLSLPFDGPIFLITSMTSGLGKTSALRLWLTQLVKQYTPSELSLVIIDYHTRTMPYFSKLPHVINLDKNNNVRSHVTRKENFKPVLDWLKEEVKQRRDKLSQMYSSSPESFDHEEVLKSLGYILVVIDDYEVFTNSRPVEFQNLFSTIVDGEEVGVRVMITEDYALLGNDDLVKRAKKYGCGLLLGGSEGLSAFNDSRPPYNQKTSNLPPGRGYVVNRNLVEFIQAATYWGENQEPTSVLKIKLESKK